MSIVDSLFALPGGGFSDGISKLLILRGSIGANLSERLVNSNKQL